MDLCRDQPPGKVPRERLQNNVFKGKTERAMPAEGTLSPIELLREQAAWLAPARSRLLRRVRIATRRRILDVGCGPGIVTSELAMRGAAEGTVLALDYNREALAPLIAAAVPACRAPATVAHICPVHATAHRMPLPDASFDLAFFQFTLMWLDAAAAVSEIARILEPGGMVAAMEPDYGGLIEHPPETATRPLWIAGLARAGAQPEIGRRLPGLFAAAGFRVHVELLDRLLPPSSTRFAMLRQLPLTPNELRHLEAVEQECANSDPRAIVAHLPLFLLTAERRGSGP